MSVYGQLLRVPHVARLLAATTLARLPIGINGLAVVLYVRAATGSFAMAGLVTGGLALGTAVGAPIVARLVDRRGLGLLMPFAFVHAAALLSIWILGESGAPGAALVGAALVAGSAFPPSGSVLRARWPELLGETGLLRTAFAFDSVMIEVSFVTGPLITAAVIALASPQLALAVSAVLVVAGTALFLAWLPRHCFHRAEPQAGGVLGALSSPAIRTIALTTLPFGFCIGAIEVALPAFSDAEGAPALAGVLLAIWSGASGIGGLVFGAHQLRRGSVETFLGIAVVFPLACLPLIAGFSPLTVAALAVVAGLPIAPLIASRNQLVGELAPRGTGTESFTWLLTALLSGAAAGAAAAGAIADAGGWRAAVLCGCAVAAAGAVFTVAQRGALRPASAG